MYINSEVLNQVILGPVLRPNVLATLNQALNTVEKVWDVTSYSYLAVVTVIGVCGCYKIFVIDKGNPFHF